MNSLRVPCQRGPAICHQANPPRCADFQAWILARLLFETKTPCQSMLDTRLRKTSSSCRFPSCIRAASRSGTRRNPKKKLGSRTPATRKRVLSRHVAEATPKFAEKGPPLHVWSPLQVSCHCYPPAPHAPNEFMMRKLHTECFWLEAPGWQHKSESCRGSRCRQCLTETHRKARRARGKGRQTPKQV